jgi:hypothetical protein
VSRVPFTPTHAAAVLPFLRTPLPASALVVGSVSPDIPYYLPGDPGLATHTALAVVTTDLALGGVAWAVWHAVLAAPALAASPAGLRARLAGVPLGLRQRLSSASAVGLTLLALVVASATHVFWDEFTHAGRWGPEHIPALREVYGPLPGWSWLQEASGLLGAAVLTVWFVRWWRRTPACDPDRRPATWWAWAVVAGAGLAAGGVAAAAAPWLGSAAFQGATWGGGAAMAAALVLAGAWHARHGPGSSPVRRGGA